MKCLYCNQEAKWVSNKIIYGKRYGKSYMCYYCENCDAYVGCHKNTRKPLGVMANKKLRKLRIECHDLFDELWKSKKMTRKKAYGFLFKNTGIKHIGFSDEEECKKIIDFLNKQRKLI